MDAKFWIEETLKRLNYQQSDKLEIIEDWFLGDVWRIPTDRGNVYFKATASLPLFSNEAEVCNYLSHIFKDNVPNVIAINKERGWQLTADFGESLEDDVDIAVWTEAYQLWGKLQSLSADHVHSLVQSGCQTRPIDSLTIQLTEHLNQPQIVAILTANNIVLENSLSSKLETTIQTLAKYSLPECLVHGDLHEGNMARTGKSYLFFDWSDACISHPFMECNFIYRFSESDEKQKLIRSYLSNWLSYLPEPELMRAWKTAEPICYAHHALTYASLVLNQDDKDDFTQSLTGYLSRLVKCI